MNQIITAINSAILDIDTRNYGEAKRKLHLVIQQLLSPPANVNSLGTSTPLQQSDGARSPDDGDR